MSKTLKGRLASVVVVSVSVVLACQLKELQTIGRIGLQLIVNCVLSVVAFRMTVYLIPRVKSMFLPKLKGIDRGRPGNFELPESLGAVPGMVFMIVLFLFIPIPSLSLQQTSFSLPFSRSKLLLVVPYFNPDDFHHDEFASMLAALLSICSMLFLGFVDDVLDLRWKHKLLLPAFASLPLLIVYAVTYNMTTVLLPRPFSCSIDLGLLYYVYMLMLGIFCTNAINILAGINGLEAGQSAVITIAIIIFNLIELTGDQWKVHLFSLSFMLPFLGVTSGLLYHNWYPADVFVGDTYCYFAGMTFAVVGILGHFSKTMLLFFAPQIFNFLISLPQLFKLVPCPRHRLPKYNPSTGLMENSTLSLDGKVSKSGIKILNVFKALKLTEERKTDKGVEYTNLTLINVALLWWGPRQQNRLTILLLAMQTISCLVAFLIRYVLVDYFY